MTANSTQDQLDLNCETIDCKLQDNSMVVNANGSVNASVNEDSISISVSASVSAKIVQNDT